MRFDNVSLIGLALLVTCSFGAPILSSKQSDGAGNNVIGDSSARARGIEPIKHAFQPWVDSGKSSHEIAARITRQIKARGFYTQASVDKAQKARDAAEKKWKTLQKAYQDNSSEDLRKNLGHKALNDKVTSTMVQEAENDYNTARRDYLMIKTEFSLQKQKDEAAGDASKPPAGGAVRSRNLDNDLTLSASNPVSYLSVRGEITEEQAKAANDKAEIAMSNWRGEDLVMAQKSPGGRTRPSSSLLQESAHKNLQNKVNSDTILRAQREYEEAEEAFERIQAQYNEQQQKKGLPTFPAQARRDVLSGY